jgi:hypothetical protein
VVLLRHPNRQETTMSESSADSGVPENEPEAEEAPEVFANRAARRAKSKGPKPEIVAKGQRAVGRGAVQNPRQYGNRRTG